MKKGKYYLCLVVTFVLWGGLYVAAKYALACFQPVTVLMLRYLLAALILGILLLRKGCQRIDRKDWKYFWLIGGVGYFLSIVLQLNGTKLLAASTASLIYALNPVITSGLAFVLLKERPSKTQVAGLIMSLAGVYVILGIGEGGWSLRGVLAMLSATFLWSLSSIVTRGISNRYDPVEITFLGMALALPFAFPASALELSAERPAVTPGGVAALIYLAVFGTVAAFTLWNIGLKGLSAATCSMLFPIQPLTSAVLGVVLLDEPVTASFLTGTAIISVGILLSAMEGKNPSRG